MFRSETLELSIHEKMFDTEHPAKDAPQNKIGGGNTSEEAQTQDEDFNQIKP